MVFPLSLTAFEEYMLADSRPAYPMEGFLRLRFAGRFDRAALAAAVRTAIERHPLLGARVRRDRRGRWQWYLAPQEPPPIRWLPGTVPIFAAGGHKNGTVPLPPAVEPLDLGAEIGLRVCVVEDHDRSDLVLRTHHANSDGLGVFQFTLEMLVAYARAMGAPLTRDWGPAPAVEELRKRGHFGITTGMWLRMLPRQLLGLLDVRSFLARSALPLVAGKPCPADGPLPPDYPASVAGQLDESAVDRLRATAARLGVTTNDLLVRDLFLALQDWRQQHLPEPGPGWLRLSVPVNLRRLGRLVLPAANVVSMVFLDRRVPRDLADPARLLRETHEEMELIKRHHLGLTFVLSMQAARRLPGGLARLASARCAATAVLSNFGAPLAEAPFPQRDGRLQIAGLVLEGVEALPPVRPYTSAVFSAVLYAGRLWLTLHYDPRMLSAPQAAALVDALTGRLRAEGG